MIHVILGHFGYTFSGGFARWGATLNDPQHPVTIWQYPQRIDLIVPAIEKQPEGEKTVLMGYSLGGNSCAWCARATKHPIDLILAFDPTRNGPPLSQYPLGKHVKKAICFCGAGYGPTSLFWGGGHLVGPQVEHIPTKVDHLFVQDSKKLRNIALEKIANVYGTDEAATA
jgi:dienelactone hydrolase